MQKRFSTFEGVFTPTVLSILGVIMYLRLGWVVGTVGLWNALGIVIMANLITLATALSMSSIVTNIRIGTGGAFSIIFKSLGLEAGGAIGIPLYLSQAISVAFYIVGFSECWLSVFPAHNAALVSIAAWAGILAVSYYSAKAAFRIQYVIMVIVGLSLVSVFLGGDPNYVKGSLIHGVSPSSFWIAFAIFFPAVTGVLAGASMSGELTDPKKSIPRGTLSAIGVTFAIYLLLAFWLGWHVPPQALVENRSILIDLGRWKYLVVAGIMGATISSALSMFVGAPRTLLALSEQSLVPSSQTFVKINKRGEPTGAVMLTSLIVLITLYFGSLDSVATLLTQVFLITYGMINLSVFIEQSIGIASFRPSFRIPRCVSFFGSVGCFGVMLLINPLFTGIAIVSIIILYIILVRRELKTRSADVRSGLLIFLAEQFVKGALRLPYHPKIWKPNVFFPTGNFDVLRKVLPLVKAFVAPSGRVLFLKVVTRPLLDMQQRFEKNADIKELNKELGEIVEPLRDDDIFVEHSVVESDDVTGGIVTSLQLSKAMFFRPNTMFCAIEEKGEHSKKILQKAAVEGLGLMALKFHDERGFGYEKTINLWLRQGSPNINLAVLAALQIQKNWDGQVRVLQAVPNEEQVAEAEAYLSSITRALRFPKDAMLQVLVGDFRTVLMTAPKADINIFGMADRPDVQMIQDVFDLVGTSVLFLRDSQFESALA